jgi:hypothetical protein
MEAMELPGNLHIAPRQHIQLKTVRQSIHTPSDREMTYRMDPKDHMTIQVIHVRVDRLCGLVVTVPGYRSR